METNSDHLGMKKRGEGNKMPRKYSHIIIPNSLYHKLLSEIYSMLFGRMYVFVYPDHMSK